MLFCSCDLDLDPMTFIYELDPYLLNIYLQTKRELSTPKLSKVISCGQMPPNLLPRCFAGIVIIIILKYAFLTRGEVLTSVATDCKGHRRTILLVRETNLKKRAHQ